MDHQAEDQQNVDLSSKMEKDQEPPKIFFHVGLGKTATTYLQYRVFPKLKGVHYIQRTKYRKSKQIIARSEYAKYLLSREFDRQLEREVLDFAAVFPQTRPIIVFRRQDSWIASQYRRFVKNGYRLSFTEFFDLENDRGFFKKEELYYYPKIQLLEQHFKYPPLVLFYEDLRNDVIRFTQLIAKEIGATFHDQDITLSRKHRSYTEKQLKVMLAAGHYLNLRKRRLSGYPLLHRLLHLGQEGLRYTILYAAPLLPDHFLSDRALIPARSLEAIKDYYIDDWIRCLQYADSGSNHSDTAKS